jgi:type II secretory pathway pseudopilin PulG
MQTSRVSGGYTIVEVMIFLAVSSFMFVIAAFFIQGKQANSQFTQAMNSINTQVQQVINNVSDSNYPPIDEQCQPDPAGGGGSVAKLTITPFGYEGSSNSQGSNIGCVVLGQTIQFGLTSNGNTGTGYNVYTVLGCQYSDCSTNFLTGDAPTSLSQASATLADPAASTGVCSPTGTISNVTTNLTSCNTLEWGMHVTAMYDYQTNGASTSVIPTNSIGFFGSFAQQQAGESGDGEGLVSGTQNVNVIDTGLIGPTYTSATPVTSVNNDEYHMVTDADGILESTTPPSFIESPYFVVCFSDGHGHVGALTIGGGSAAGSSGQRLATYTQIGDSTIYPFGSGNYANDACVAN